MSWTRKRCPFLYFGLATAILLLVSVPLRATSIKSSYDGKNKRVTVEVTGISENWDDLEVQVERGDVAGNFTTPTPNWAVDGIIERNGKKFVRLKRTPKIASDETVVIEHADDRQRGRNGTVSLTLDNVPFTSKSGPTLIASRVGPVGGCIFGNQPAATLLIPYFEVDLGNPAGQTTLISLNNAEPAPTLSRVTLWTDWGVPTLVFYVLLSGFDVQTVNLRDALNGNLPRTSDVLNDPSLPPSEVPVCTAAELDYAPAPSQVLALQADHKGMLNPVAGNCAGSNHGDAKARGYVTVDMVERCAYPPTAAAYAVADPVGRGLGMDNSLWGDYFYVNPGQNSAQSEPAVSVVADPSSFAPGDYTFYGRYNELTASDARAPLSSHYLSRYLNGGVFNGGTDLLIWRDHRRSDLARVPCGTQPSWLPLGEQSVVGYDEAENSFELPGLASVCPDSNAALSFSCHVAGVEPPFGFLSLDLWHGDGTPAQAWVTAAISAEGRFSVAHSSARLDDLCATDTAGVP